MIVYIDDWLRIARSQAEAREAFSFVSNLLIALGFLLNLAKSVSEPTQQIQFLGHLVDSVTMTFQLIPAKVEKVQNLCRIIWVTDFC